MKLFIKSDAGFDPMTGTPVPASIETVRIAEDKWAWASSVGLLSLILALFAGSALALFLR